MLRSLRVRNFGVIEEVEVELGSGLTVMTGETGAGKSLLLDALLLLAGGRSDADMIRSGADEAEVEGVFELNAELGTRLEESGLGRGGDEVLIRRTVSAHGRSRAWVNGSLVTVGVLQGVMRGVVDIAGQLEHASLYDEENHRSLVDRFGGLDGAQGPRAAYQALFETRRLALNRLTELGGDEREVRAKLEFLRYQVKELEAARVEVGEEARLEADRRRLSGAARLEALARAADQVLSQQEANAGDLLREASLRLGEMEKVDPAVRAVRERVVAATLELEEGCRALSRYLATLEHEPGRLRDLEERLDLVRSLSRKHGTTVDELPARLAALSVQLEQVENRGALREEALAEVARLERALGETGGALSVARRAAAQRLEADVKSALAKLALKSACFRVEVTSGAPAATGLDVVRFLFSANPGEPARPLARIASGGEASRVMLAIKAVLASTERVAVSVLDEVDTGVGGAVADVVGRLIRDVAVHRQVLCITHLPQVAAHAERHLRVRKQEEGGRVRSSIEVLTTTDARSDELARMLSGVEVSREARAAAQVLIASAARSEAPQARRRKRVVQRSADRRSA